MAAFELTEVQTNYILDMPLRRLTRFSRIELEAERDQLNATIVELTQILENPEQLRTVVGLELAEVAQQHGTPRRTILLASSGVAAVATGTPLEVADDPCWVLMSSAGLLARTDHANPLAVGGERANHDVLISAVTTTARADLGLVTSAGRLIKINALDLPTVPTTANALNLQGGTHVSELITLDTDERALCLEHPRSGIGRARDRHGPWRRQAGAPGGAGKGLLGSDPAGPGRPGGGGRRTDS